MTEKDQLKAKLEMLFAAALMEVPDETGPAKRTETAGPVPSPSLASPPQGPYIGGNSQYGAKSVPTPPFHGIVT
jgi:hypothetical protein